MLSRVEQKKLVKV